MYSYGNIWRFRFQAKQSAILVYGESPREHNRNAQNRVLKLGCDRIPEKQEYDHVGTKSCFYSDSEPRVSEEVSKGRNVLNVAPGIGIRKNGLNTIFCNLIFWAVIVSILTFGCDMWILSVKDEEDILSFQRFAGRHIQRFPQRSPNLTSSFGSRLDKAYSVYFS